MRRRALLSSLCAVLLSFAGCRTPHQPPHIIVIIADALRADRIAMQRQGKPLAPFLHDLQQRAVSFENAYTVAPWTMPSLASLWTARYPTQHQVDRFDALLPEGETTLAEVLQQHGYRTAGFSANVLVHIHSGFAQGFETYLVKAPLGEDLAARGKTRAGEINQAALAWVDGIRTQPARPIFLYLHYLDTHEPYTAPRAAIEAALQGRPDAEVLYAALDAAQWRWQGFAKVPPLTTHAAHEALYDAEVASFDADLQRLFAALDRRGILQNSVVVVTSDHGEAFGEHGSGGHAHVLYEEVMRVPLLITTPTGQRRRVTTPVSLADVMPALLDLAGIAPPAQLEGRSLHALLHHNETLVRGWERVRRLGGASRRLPLGTVYAEIGNNDPRQIARVEHRRALWIGSHKVIEHLDGSHVAYDLRADPHEQQPLAAADAPAQRLSGALAAAAQHLAGTAQPAARRQVSDEVKEQMRALGYEH